MGQKLSKLSLALIAAGFSLGVCGTTYGKVDNNSFPAVIPVHQGCYNFGLAAFLAYPCDNDAVHAIAGSKSGDRVFHNIDGRSEFGFRLDVTKVFGGTGLDCNLNWTHFCADNDDTAYPLAFGEKLSSRFFKGTKFDTVTGSSEFDFDEVNLEVGQLLDYSDLYTRLHFGLSWARIDNDIDSHGDTIATDNTAFGQFHMKSEFCGIGPRLGLDINYPVGCFHNTSIVAHSAVALLAGEIDVETHGAFRKSGETLTFWVKTDEQCSLVPAATMKLGLRYACDQAPTGRGYAFEGGFQATGYYHVISKPNSKGESFVSSNYGMYGFYFAFNYGV